MTQPISLSNSSSQTQRQRQRLQTRWLAAGTALVVLLAWLYGYFASGVDAAPQVLNVLPGAARIETRGDLYIGLGPDGALIGYAAIGQSQGYAGPIEMLVGIDPSGHIIGTHILQQSETPGFFRLLESHDFIDQFANRQAGESLYLGAGLDAVSGATFSAEGVAASVRQALRTLSSEALGTSLPPEKAPIQFGIPEVVLILLFAAGYFGHRTRNGTWKKGIRWATLLTGMVMIGFVYTLPFTIAQVVALLSGYWPDWHNHLYWYLLIGGIVFVTTVDSKNPYCAWFCPFGAFQECLGTLTGAKFYRPKAYANWFTWAQRGLALTAILLGLVLRRPGIAGYEPFATLFDLRGTPVQWIFLLIVVLSSLLIYRPFCNYLCPLDPVFDFIAETRRQIMEAFRQWRNPSLKE